MDMNVTMQSVFFMKHVQMQRVIGSLAELIQLYVTTYSQYSLLNLALEILRFMRYPCLKFNQRPCPLFSTYLKAG